MCNIAVSAICCTVQTISNCLCQICCKCCSVTFKQQVKLAYILMFSICIIFSTIVMYYIQNLMQNFSKFIHCPQNTGGELVCLGISNVLRMSLTLASLHLFLALLMLIRGKTAKCLNEGMFLMKVVYIITIYILLHMISNDVMLQYMYVSRIISFVFLLFQLIMLIDVFYLWGQQWVENYDSGVECFKYLLILFSFVLFSFYSVLLVLSFQYFSGEMNIIFMIINIIISLILCIMICAGIRQNGSLLTTAALILYAAYLQWSAMASHNNPNHNKILKDNLFNIEMTLELIINVLLALISLIYMSFQAKQQSQHFKLINNQLLAEEKDHNQYIDDNNQQIQAQPQQQQQQQQQQIQLVIENNDYSDYQNNNYTYFHLVMCILAFYICMILTNWGVPQIGSQTINNFKPSIISYWVKIINSWITLLLYFWTLIAPRIIVNRQFD